MAQTTTKKKTTSGKSTSKKSSTKGKSSSAKKTKEPEKKPVRREITAAIFGVLAVLVVIGYFTGNEGFLVAAISRLIKGLLGYGFYAVGPAFILVAVIMGFHRGRPVAWRTTAALLMPVTVSAFADLLLSKVNLAETASLIPSLYGFGKEMMCGGVIGSLISYGLESAITGFAAGAILLVLTLVFIMAALNITVKKLYGWISSRELPEYKEEPEPERKPKVKKQAEIKDAEAENIRAKKVRHGIDIPMDDEPDDEPVRKKREAPEESPKKSEEKGILRNRSRVRPAPVDKREPVKEPEPVSAEEEKIAEAAPVNLSGSGRTAAAEVKEPPKKMSSEEMAAQTAAIEEEINSAEKNGGYEKPPIFLLKKGHSGEIDSASELRTNRERLESAIKSFGVNARVVDTTHGPTVTRYDVELEQGVKLSRLTNLAGDIALALGVVSVRIAPIPEKISTVGIEVPNKLISTVYLRDIIDSPKFSKAKSDLTFAIGKDIGGEPVVGNISKLPHLLIAGTTGSGKSVCMNSLIISLLYKSDPEDVKLIMIDPKMVEMGVYNGIPHLYIPVVTDPKKAAGALQWAVTEMLKRYRMFSEIGVRGLEAYNEHLIANGQPKMPNVVVVIDELADLMLVASKDVEESICRVAQMGRAAGMHLVIATQRPSADVITGLMKANIPSRIAFAVSSGLESRIILDNVGAEKLIGMGDMLYAPLGCGKPQRVQGAFVSDEERDSIVSFIKEQCQAEYSQDVMAQIEKNAEDKNANNKNADKEETSDKGDFDELLPQAADVIFDTKQASVSMLQRRLKLGYARAARIIDQMEEMGILGPFEGSKPRQILITRDQWIEMQSVQGTAPIENINPEDFDN